MIEVIVTEGKMLKMGEFKEGTVGREGAIEAASGEVESCLLYTSPSPRDGLLSRMPSSA